MTDQLTPEMKAMLRINDARKLATEPDHKPKPAKSTNTAPQPSRAPETSVTPSEVLVEPSITGRLPRGVLRRQQIHAIMAGDWEILGEHHSMDGKRSLTTACGYKAKRVFSLKDKQTGRVICAARGEINAHTNLIIPKDDKEARKLSVSSAFA